MTDFFFGGLEMMANTERELALMVLREGAAHGVSVLDLLGTFTLGSRRFVRFRADRQLGPILKAMSRGTIYAEGGQYIVSLNGKVGKVDSAKITVMSLGYPKRFNLQS